MDTFRQAQEAILLRARALEKEGRFNDLRALRRLLEDEARQRDLDFDRVNRQYHEACNRLKSCEDPEEQARLDEWICTLREQRAARLEHVKEKHGALSAVEMILNALTWGGLRDLVGPKAETGGRDRDAPAYARLLLDAYRRNRPNIRMRKDLAAKIGAGGDDVIRTVHRALKRRGFQWKSRDVQDFMRAVEQYLSDIGHLPDTR